MQGKPPDRDTILDFIADIFNRRGADSYLGEVVSMSEHMLQTALNAERAGESDAVITAALLHDIGHYTGEFPEDYIERGVDNCHEAAGAAILERFFPPAVTEPVRWHVAAKRYLCAVDAEYFATLSPASVKTLELQGGPFSAREAARFEDNPYLDSILRVRRYDDAGKTPGVRTPDVRHYLGIAERTLRR